MRTKKYDKFGFGIVLGLITPLLGFVIYGMYWAWDYDRTFSYFVNGIFIGTPTHRSSIIVLSLLFNLIPFLIFIRKERFRAAKGVMMAIFLFVPVVLYYKFI